MDNDCINLFTGLESLGFEDVDLFTLYKSEEEKKNPASQEAKQESYLYDKTIDCPVCGKTTKIKAVKTGAPRIDKRDSDFMTYYTSINPMFYEVLYCKVCGHAGLQKSFFSLTEREKKAVLTKITPNWKSKDYPENYDVDIAIEQHKLALLNAAVRDSRAGEKAILCLKISWLYRLKNDKELETLFQNQAIRGLELAYTDAEFPLYGLDKYSMLYLIGELFRRIGDNIKALKYFGNVLTDMKCPAKIKEKARDQKDLIKDSATAQ